MIVCFYFETKSNTQTRLRFQCIQFYYLVAWSLDWCVNLKILVLYLMLKRVLYEWLVLTWILNVTYEVVKIISNVLWKQIKILRRKLFWCQLNFKYEFWTWKFIILPWFSHSQFSFLKLFFIQHFLMNAKCIMFHL